MRSFDDFLFKCEELLPAPLDDWCFSPVLLDGRTFVLLLLG